MVMPSLRPSAWRHQPVRVGAACLPVDDKNPEKRAKQLAARRREYSYTIMYPGLPPLMDHTPKNELYEETSAQDAEFDLRLADNLGDLAYQKLVHAFAADEDGWEKWRTPLSAATDIGHGVPYVGTHPENRWLADAEFGWQKMNGVVPFHMRACAQIPAGFAVDDAALTGVLPAGTTLAQLIAAGRLFLSDYTQFEDASLALDPAACCASGWVLLWSDDERVLMPLAIQLHSDAARSPVFTPRDGNNWLAAKTHAQAAEHSYDSVYHVFGCHLVGETIYDAMQRCLHRNHPIHVLLREHFTYNVGVNDRVKKNVMDGDNPSDMFFSVGGRRKELMALNNKDWDLNFRMNMPEQMRLRGVASKEVLPANHWRDDTLELWAAIDKYVGGVLACFYDADGDVAADAELAAWVAELQAPRHSAIGEALPDGTGCGFRGLPVGADGAMTTRAQVRLFVTMVLNNQTVNHTAGGGSGYQMTAFVPNMPGQFHLPLAELKAAKDGGTDVTLRRIREALPGLAGVGMAVMNTKNHSDTKAKPLPSYNGNFFRAARVRAHLDAFAYDLREVELAILLRNQRRPRCGERRPYRFLLPSGIGMSVNK
jgi:hypothetical protein